ncbi:DUF2341 domain-containing protein, partial [Candidatus Dojkabacteria bacterium]|nr:DUF2341 domain-containing protein [Candidatus Dojkabacteria bacterium]
SYVWVRVPQVNLESTTDSIYMYYGNIAATDAQAPSSVWPASEYSMVYHFGEVTGTSGANSVEDSTGNTFGTPSSGITFGNAGQIGTTADFSNGTGISVGSLASPLLTAETTISFWLNAVNFASPARQNPFDHSYGGWGTMTIETNTRISWFFGSHGGNSSPYVNYTSQNLMSNGNWIYVTVTRQPVGYAYKWYINGAYSSGGTYNSAYPNIVSQNFTIGDGYVNPFEGRIDEFRVQKVQRSAAWVAASYSSDMDSFASVGAAEGKYTTSGTLVSNVFNPTYPADWQLLSYTTAGSGTVTVKARTDNSSDMSGATDWASCSAITSGSDPATGGCVTDTDQYFQYQVTLATSGLDTPTLQEIDVQYEASDLIAPTTNASNVQMTAVADADWTNTEPTFTWTAGADNAGGSGLLGYCIALDEADIASPNTLDPAITAGKLTGIDDGVSSVACPFIATGTSLDLSSLTGLSLVTGKQYYFSIKAVDIPGNIWTGPAGQFQELIS